MNIIVLCGGVSTERDVSLTSGKMAAAALKRIGHKVVLVDLFFGYPHPYNDPAEIFDHDFGDELDATINDVPDLDALMKKRGGDNRSRIGANVVDICSAADIVFLALHGNDGEDGKIQAMFELYGIKYTGCDSLGSAVAMNKGVAKMLFLQNGISTPTGIVVNKNDSEYKNPGFPCVVKPRSGGSSVGTSVVTREEDYLAALELAFKYESDVLVENYIKGREFSVGVINGKALPAIEICPKSGFFDYKNKYLANLTDEYCPANISPETEKQLQNAALAVFDALMLKVYARIDFILDENGREWCLEANTLPGLTPSSLMPKEAAVAGIPYDDFCALIIEKSLEKYN
ncbi:MAG: D-alanine--D-alanine ligase [Oscillospiraceae bacterium]|nr:D-alanine--D-alanine ligase [Oscillospiraceae bacterium]MBQ9938779.1 D-alanine--D-alanine ligase [Oscillospiraceae bacterium]